MTLPPDLALLDSAGKDALILALFERLNDLTARLEILEAENAALRAENAWCSASSPDGMYPAVLCGGMNLDGLLCRTGFPPWSMAPAAWNEAASGLWPRDR